MAGAKECECETASGGRLCPTRMPPKCECLVDDSVRLCPTPPSPDGACGGQRLYLSLPYGGPDKKTGGACTGYADGTAGSAPVSGTLSCEVCYERQKVAGEHGDPCAGVDAWGAPGRGKLVCR